MLLSIGLVPLPVIFRFASCFSDLTQKAEEPPPKITIKERIANMPAAHHGMMLNAPNAMAMPKVRTAQTVKRVSGSSVAPRTLQHCAIKNQLAGLGVNVSSITVPPQHDHNPNRNRRVCRGGNPLRDCRMPVGDRQSRTLNPKR